MHLSRYVVTTYRCSERDCPIEVLVLRTLVVRVRHGVSIRVEEVRRVGNHSAEYTCYQGSTDAAC